MVGDGGGGCFEDAFLVTAGVGALGTRVGHLGLQGLLNGVGPHIVANHKWRSTPFSGGELRVARAGFGRVGIWGGGFDEQPLNVVRESAKGIEEFGFGALWLPETTGREAMSQAALVLAATRRITVATGVAGVHARDAVTTAAGRRTLDEAFPGRFVLGLGIGHPALVEDVRGHHFTPPIATMREYLDALDRAPFGPPDAASRPVGSGREATVVAALGPRMLGVARERAGGALVLGMPVEHTRAARDILGEDGFLGVVLLAVVDPSRAEFEGLARDTVAAALPNRRGLLKKLGYSDSSEQLVDAMVAWGDKERVVQRVREHLDAGADHVALHVITATPGVAPLPLWRELAEALR